MREELALAWARLDEWNRSDSRIPTNDDFGVALRPLRLPTPDALLDVLDEDGYVRAAIAATKGALAGQPLAVVVAATGLLPPSSATRVAAGGIVAALKGDVPNALRAVAKLAGKGDEAVAVEQRLARYVGLARRVEGVLGPMPVLNHAKRP